MSNYDHDQGVGHTLIALFILALFVFGAVMIASSVTSGGLCSRAFDRSHNAADTAAVIRLTNGDCNLPHNNQ